MISLQQNTASPSGDIEDHRIETQNNLLDNHLGHQQAENKFQPEVNDFLNVHTTSNISYLTSCVKFMKLTTCFLQKILTQSRYPSISTQAGD